MTLLLVLYLLLWQFGGSFKCRDESLMKRNELCLRFCHQLLLSLTTHVLKEADFRYVFIFISYSSSHSVYYSVKK